MVDNHAQLRIVMHLYHGLLLNGIVESGKIPFLDMLYASFKNSRAIWGGALPRRGELVKRFWACFGMNLGDSKKMAEEARGVYDSGLGGGIDEAHTSWRIRKVNAIKPEEMSTSYRRVCNRDFHDVVDKYHTAEQRERNKGSEYYKLAVRINDTLDAIDEEQQLLGFNLVSCGAALEQFVCSLLRIMQCYPAIKSYTGSDATIHVDHREGAVHMFAQHLLGALDFSSDPMDHEFLDVTLGFLTVYFTNLDPAKVGWFQRVGYR